MAAGAPRWAHPRRAGRGVDPGWRQPRRAWPDLDRRMRELADRRGSARCSPGTSRYMPAAGRRRAAARAGDAREACCTSRLVDERFGEPLDARRRRADDDSERNAHAARARRERDRAVRLPTELVRELATPESAGSRPGSGRARRATSRCSDPARAPRASSSARRPTSSATTASATTPCSTSSSPACASPASSRCCTALRDELVAVRRSRSLARRGPTTRSLHRDVPRRRAVGVHVRAARATSASTSTPAATTAAAHPFSGGAGPRDVPPHDARSPRRPAAGALATLHEAGHGLYEQGLDRRLRRHAAAAGRLARHARVAVAPVGEPGRPRPRRSGSTSSRGLREHVPGALADVDARRLLSRRQRRRAVAHPRRGRRGRPTTCTSSLRFELEQALLSRRPRRGRPARRVERRSSSASLGVAPPDDARRRACRTSTGAAAAIGYFPTYTLGNLYAAQLMASGARATWPSLDDDVPPRRVRAAARLAPRERPPPGSRCRAERPVARASPARRSTTEPLVALPAREVRAALRARRSASRSAERVPGDGAGAGASSVGQRSARTTRASTSAIVADVRRRDTRQTTNAVNPSATPAATPNSAP